MIKVAQNVSKIAEFAICLPKYFWNILPVGATWFILTHLLASIPMPFCSSHCDRNTQPLVLTTNCPNNEFVLFFNKWASPQQTQSTLLNALSKNLETILWFYIQSQINLSNGNLLIHCVGCLGSIVKTMYTGIFSQFLNLEQRKSQFNQEPQWELCFFVLDYLVDIGEHSTLSRS